MQELRRIAATTDAPKALDIAQAEGGIENLMASTVYTNQCPNPAIVEALPVALETRRVESGH